MVHMSLATMLPRWVPWLGSGAGERRNLVLRKEGIGKNRPVSSVSILGQKPIIEIKSHIEMLVPRWRLNWVADTFRHPGPMNRRRRHAPLSLQNKRQGKQRRGWGYNGRDALMQRAAKRCCSTKAFRHARNVARRALRIANVGNAGALKSVRR